MATLSGHITSMRVYEAEGMTDWALALSKIVWIIIFLLFPFSVFRFLNDFFGVFIASMGIVFLLILFRLVGPFNLVMLDELMGRVFPALRTCLRTGRVRVYDFRIKSPESQNQVGCILRGNLTGAAPAKGDDVALVGRDEEGTFRVFRGCNRTTRSNITIQSTHSGWILLITSALAVLFSCYLMGEIDSWLYPLVDSVLYDFLNSIGTEAL